MKRTGLTLLFFFNWLLVAAQVFDVDTIRYSGDSDNRINLVILSDGYQKHELPKFSRDAGAFAKSFFSESPFAEYQDFFNVFIIKVPSNESGAGHPGTATDLAEPAHPVQETDNYFGSSFDHFGIHRLLVPQNTAAITNVLAHNFPAYDEVLILVNSPFYGGSGGEYATASLHESATQIAIHEMGHSFVGLKDEYFAGDRYLGEAINMTRETDPEKVKWKNWIGYQETGIFQHCCGGNSESWYRPHQNCKMRYLGRPFCPVCVEGTVEKIHSLVSVIDGRLPAGDVVINDLSPVTFELKLIKSVPDALKIKWLLNGQEFKKNKSSVVISAENLKKGENVLKVMAEDTTRLVRTNNHKEVHSATFSWAIQNNVSDNARLAALSVEGAPLTPAFSPVVVSYNSTAAHELSAVSVTALTENEQAKITVNEKALVSGTASSAIALKEGSNNILIKVIAQDGKTTKTYSVVVERKSPPAKTAPEITFPGLTIPYTPAAYNLSASSNSSGAVTYEIVEELTAAYPGDVTLSGTRKGILNVVKSGKVRIRAKVAEDDKYLAGSAETDILITKAVAKISVKETEKVYDGSPKQVIISTEPEGLKTQVYYNGSPQVPVKAGEYTIRAVVADNNYTAEAAATLRIAKANAIISFSEVEKVYDGTSKTLKVTTIPSGLETKILYNNSKEAPVAAGGYTVQVVVNNENYTAEAESKLTIKKAAAKVAFTSLKQIYSSSPKPLAVSTIPEGLATEVFYNGSKEVPVKAGNYEVRAVVKNENYAGEVTATLSIQKATAQVNIHGRDQEYDGLPKAVVVSTSPEGLATEVFYDGSKTLPVAAGEYEVRAVITNDNYAGEGTGIFNIIKSTATIRLSNLKQEYDGFPKPVTVSTVPAGLATEVFYNGSKEAPVAAGEYQVRAVIKDKNLSDEATGTLTIKKATAEITITGVEKVYDGLPKAVKITTVPEGLPAEVYYNESKEIPVAAGTYEVRAVVNHKNYIAETSGLITILKARAKVTIGGLTHDYDGTPKEVTVTTVPAGLTAEVLYNGSAETPVAAGSYQVQAEVKDKNYSGEAGAAMTIKAPSANLAALSVGKTPLSPAFAPSVREYSIKVGYAVASVKVVAATQDPLATLSVNDITVAGGTPSQGIALQNGTNTIEVKVTAQDGLATKTYTIKAERESPPAKIPPVLTFIDQSVTFGADDFSLMAVSNSTGVITYEIDDELSDAYPGDVSLSGPGNSIVSLVKSGRVRLTATIEENDVYLAESAEMDLTIHKGAASISIAGLIQDYTGEPRAVQLKTEPEGLVAEIRYNGSSEMPAEAGEHEVFVFIVDENFEGEKKAVLTINMPTAISPGEEAKEIRLYPNPTRNMAILELEDGMTADVKVMDISGRFIKQERISESSEVDLENHPAGTYLIMVQPEGKAPLYLRLLKL